MTEKVWVPLADAAKHYGVKTVTIRNSIMRGSDKYRWKKVSGIGGRGYVYKIEIEVRREADPPEQEPPKAEEEEHNKVARYLRAPAEKKRDADLRLELVRKYDDRKNQTITEFLERLHPRFGAIKPTETKLYRWRKLVLAAKENGTNPLDDLLDTRGMDREAWRMTPEMQKAVETMILEKPDRKVSRIYKFLSEDFADMPDYTTVARYVREWKQKNALLYAFAKDPSGAVSKYRPAPGDAAGDAGYRNAVWELDATPADIICSDGKRRTLSAAIDVFSRRVVVHLAETSSFATHGRMLKKAILKLGVPDVIKTDNGKDYVSNNFSYVCARLETSHVKTAPYSGYLKPFIERFFRRISHDLFEELDGYIGHNVGERSAIINRQTFPGKLESIKLWREKYKDGDEFAKRFALKKENRGMAVEVPLSPEELQYWIDRWIVVYEHEHHRTLKTTPIRKWDSDIQPVRRITDERMLDILVGFSIQRTITKKGVNFFGTQYYADPFYRMGGDKVWVLSDDDMGYVYVYDMDYHFIAKATNLKHMGESRTEHLAAAKRFDAMGRKIVKVLKAVQEDAPQRMQKWIESRIAEIGEDLRNVIEVGYHHKNDATDAIADALEAEVPGSTEGLRTEDGTVAVVNGRPLFADRYERFLWCLEHHEWSDEDAALAAEYPDDYDRAKEHYELFTA